MTGGAGPRNRARLHSPQNELHSRPACPSQGRWRFSLPSRLHLRAGNLFAALGQGGLHSIKVPAEIGPDKANTMGREMHTWAQYISGAKSRERVFGYTQCGLHLTSGKGKRHESKE